MFRTKKEMIDKLTKAWKEFEEKGFVDLEDGCFLQRGHDIFDAEAKYLKEYEEKVYKNGTSSEIEDWERFKEIWEDDEDYIYLTTDTGDNPQRIYNLEDLIEDYSQRAYILYEEDEEDEEEEQED